MKALVIVDLQNDFVEGGALAVKGGNEIVNLTNSLIEKFEICVATQDYHPRNHGSFAPTPEQIGTLGQLGGFPQVLWPVHCVQGTRGAEFVNNLKVELIDKVIAKGTNPLIDSYSGFFDNCRLQGTGLDEYLQERQVAELFIVGLATDYCVKFTALDAVSLGYKTYLIEDACRGVNLNLGDVDNALKEMASKGVILTNSKEILTC